LEQRRYFTIRAVKDSKCLVVKDTGLHALAFEYPEILMRMGNALSNRVIKGMKNRDGLR